MLDFLRKMIPDRHPIRLFYHKMMAVLAAIFYGFPARKLNVIFVTGTNGKTTTTNLIADILHYSGKKVGMISTINFRIGDVVWANKLKKTTLGRFGSQKLIRQMVDNNCEYLVMEVSSHAVTQNRIWGINYDTAVLTNMGEDHIEYHGSYIAYRDAKFELFNKLNTLPRKTNISKLIVLNKGDKEFNYFNEAIADKMVTYGIERGDIKAIDVKYLSNGSKFVLKIPNEEVDVHLNLPGYYNIENALAAASIALFNNIPLNTIKAALEHVEKIPGRSEIVDMGQNYQIIVDYAHDPNSLKNILEILSKTTKNDLIIVFGATGGGRDKSKRPEMGKMADKYADMIVLTNDDPYGEDQWSIIQDLAGGIERDEGDHLWKIPDRREAIKMALTIAKEGDTILVAGKGCEEVIAIGNEFIKWNDKEVIQDLLTQKMYIKGKDGKKKEIKNFMFN